MLISPFYRRASRREIYGLNRDRRDFRTGYQRTDRALGVKFDKRELGRAARPSARARNNGAHRGDNKIKKGNFKLSLSNEQKERRELLFERAFGF